MILGVLFLAIPFAFGVLRFRTTGDDSRYLIVAIASSLGALLVLVRPRMTAAPTVARALAAVAVATLCAAVASFVVGSRNAISVAVVSLSFAVCSAAGAFLVARSRIGR